MKNDKGYTQLNSAGSQGLGSVKIISVLFPLHSFENKKSIIISEALLINFHLKFAFLGGISSKQGQKRP